MGKSKHELYLLCRLVADGDAPVVQCVVDACSECHKPVWHAVADPNIPAICKDCLLLLVQHGKYEEVTVHQPTPRQRAELKKVLADSGYDG